MASCTLDASTKIYAYRVDNVHTDTLKMAGGLGRTKEKPTEEDGQEGAPGDLKNKKKSKSKKSNFIVSNTKSIDVPHFDLEFDVDPLFKKTASQFDEGRCGGGQFLSSLMMQVSTSLQKFLCNIYIIFSFQDDKNQLMLDSETMITDLIDSPLNTETKSEVASIPPFAGFIMLNFNLIVNII